MTLRKSLSLSEPQSPHLSMSMVTPCPSFLTWGTVLRSGGSCCDGVGGKGSRRAVQTSTAALVTMFSFQRAGRPAQAGPSVPRLP